MRCIGIMTGNSLDAVDAVITEFRNSQIKDLCGCSIPFPPDLADRFRRLKTLLAQNGGDISTIASDPASEFDSLHNDYIRLAARAVKELLHQSKLTPADIAAIGFHGQTCAHFPPSISPEDVHTLQIGSGQMLADLTGIPVVFDFRSDDLMNGGEAAPLAPVHNRHIAADLKEKGIFPVAFCNGGNTGNLAVISEDTGAQQRILGFDTGPFNHFPDTLARLEQNLPCDLDGRFGSRGTVNPELLRRLFNQSVITSSGENFLLKAPPKSSDPAWYKIIPELTDPNMSFEDRIRTAEFFSAYIFVYSLKYIPDSWRKPDFFLIFGGGWRNPVVLKDFSALLRGKAEVLPEHRQIFQTIVNPQAQICWSDQYGYGGHYMEARIFADMARCKLIGEPFSFPETTGCKTPTVGGILVHPGEGNTQRWSRAAKGWRLKQS